MTIFVVEVISSFLGPLLVAALAFLGWLVVARRMPGAPRPMGRLAFGLIYVTLGGLLLGTGFVWLQVAAFGIDLATLAVLVWTAGLTLALAWAARGRSVSGWGSTDKAVLPPLALILMLRPPRGRIPARRLTRRALQAELFLVVMLAAAIPGAILTLITPEARRTVLLHTLDLPVPRALQVQAAYAQALAPLVLNDITVMLGARVVETDLTIRYRITGDAAHGIDLRQFHATVSNRLAPSICMNPNFRHIIDAGGTITYAYSIDQASDVPVNALITVDRCGGLI